MGWLDKFFTELEIQWSGVAQPARGALNFVGSGFTVTDEPGSDRINVQLNVDVAGTPAATPNTIVKRDDDAAAAFGGLTTPKLDATGDLAITVGAGHVVTFGDGVEALRLVPDSDGTAELLFGGGVTAATITQSKKSGTGAAAGRAMIVRGQPGQDVSSGTNNSGADVQIHGGAAGAGGSGGAPGGVEIFADATSLLRFSLFAPGVSLEKPIKPAGTGTAAGATLALAGGDGQDVASGTNNNGGDLFLGGGAAGAGGSGGSAGKVAVGSNVHLNNGLSIDFTGGVKISDGGVSVLTSLSGPTTDVTLAAVDDLSLTAADVFVTGSTSATIDGGPLVKLKVASGGTHEIEYNGHGLITTTVASGFIIEQIGDNVGGGASYSGRSWVDNQARDALDFTLDGAGATQILFGAFVTAGIGQRKQSGTGVQSIVPMTIAAADGRDVASGTNNDGQDLHLAGGDPGTGGVAGASGKVMIDTDVTLVGDIVGNPTFRAQADHKVMFVGDSITQGFSVGPNVGGFRLPLWQMIRAARNDIDVIGFLHTYFDVDPTYAAYTGSPPLYALQRWKHSGYSGKKIEDITTNYTSGNVAVSGQPDLVFVMVGTNNVAAGDSAATMETKYNTMLDQIHAVSPSARIVICAICPFVAGSTVGGNLAAWNGVRDTFVTWLADAVNGPLATRRYVEFLDPTSELSGADILSDGVHPNAPGFSKIARTYFDRLDGLYSVRRGLTNPRAFRQRLLQSSLKLATASADFVQFSSDASKSPASGDFAVFFTFYPTALPASLGVLFQYGVPYTSGLMIASNGAGIGVYLIAGAPVIGAGTNSPLILNRPHRIGVIGNRSRGLVGLYVNGNPVAIAAGVPAWTVATNLDAFIGTAGGIDGAVGYYQELRFFKGSSVPQIETKACSDAVEADYFEASALCAGGTSYVPFNEGTGVSAADVVNGGVTGALAAGGGITTDWQLQTFPWNPGF